MLCAGTIYLYETIRVSIILTEVPRVFPPNRSALQTLMFEHDALSPLELRATLTELMKHSDLHELMRERAKLVFLEEKCGSQMCTFPASSAFGL